MAKKERKPDEQIFLFAVKVTFITSFVFLFALGVDMYHVFQFVTSLYASNV